MLLSDCDIAILCGGKGTRLAPVIGDIPKALAPVNGKPVLAHILDYIKEYGAKEVVLCTAHRAKQIDEWLDDYSTPLRILQSVEKEPRGEKSAIEAARKTFSRQHLVIFNGDTLLRGDFAALPRQQTPISYCVGGLGTGIRYVPRDVVSGKYPVDWFLSIDVSFVMSFLDIGTPEGYEKAQKEWT